MGGGDSCSGVSPTMEGAADLAPERDQHTKFFSLEQNEVPFWMLTATAPALLTQDSSLSKQPGSRGAPAFLEPLPQTLWGL